MAYPRSPLQKVGIAGCQAPVKVCASSEHRMQEGARFPRAASLFEHCFYAANLVVRGLGRAFLVCLSVFRLQKVGIPGSSGGVLLLNIARRGGAVLPAARKAPNIFWPSFLIVPHAVLWFTHTNRVHVPIKPMG